MALLTRQIVGSLILPLLRIGMIDRTGCVLLGAAIGIVVAFRSIRTGTNQLYDKMEPTRGSDLGPSFGSPRPVLNLE